MEGNIILSVCIATYNRCEILKKKLEMIFDIASDELEVLVLDDASSDGTREMLMNTHDPRLAVLNNAERNGDKKDGVMQNWYKLFESCRGKFAFHLNDRDLIDTDGVVDLIAFLKNHPTVMGGLCNIRGGTSCLNLPKNALWRSLTLDRIQLA